MRILIAEDDQVLADGLLRTLRASGAATDHVASGSECDAALMTNTEFDLLILDTVGGGQNQHRHGGAASAQAFEDFQSVHARQTEVENQQVELGVRHEGGIAL